MGMRTCPNFREQALLARAQKHIPHLAQIQGVRMIGVCNSLSMYATHTGSDIDLFIVTEPGMLWWVRIWVTYYFWKRGLWRKNQDIAGHFCLSFFATTNALDFTHIAIKNDIYLYYWIYYMKVVYTADHTYERFLEVNPWVNIPAEVQKKNLEYRLSLPTPKKTSWSARLSSRFLGWIGTIKTMRRFRRMGSPFGVIISPNMLKFHDQDRRAYFRDQILARYPSTTDTHSITHRTDQISHTDAHIPKKTQKNFDK